MTYKCWQKEILNTKFNLESKFEIKMGPVYLKTQRWRRFPYFRQYRHFENILFELGSVDYSQLQIFILIRFWEIKKFLTNGLHESACIKYIPGVELFYET
jgi:hypothetical protein